jgi:hypothetical protein
VVELLRLGHIDNQDPLVLAIVVAHSHKRTCNNVKVTLTTIILLYLCVCLEDSKNKSLELTCT